MAPRKLDQYWKTGATCFQSNSTTLYAIVHSTIQENLRTDNLEEPFVAL